jgi:hypothetical protein
MRYQKAVVSLFMNAAMAGAAGLAFGSWQKSADAGAFVGLLLVIVAIYRFEPEADDAEKRRQ